jgi:hypothetical protein
MLSKKTFGNWNILCTECDEGYVMIDISQNSYDCTPKRNEFDHTKTTPPASIGLKIK